MRLRLCVTGSARAAHTHFCPLFTKELRPAPRAPLVTNDLALRAVVTGSELVFMNVGFHFVENL